MAIVTFWNDNTGKIGQTYSATAIASFMGIEHNYKTLLMSTRYNDQVAMNAFGAENRNKTLGKLTKGMNTMDLESGMEGLAKLVSANRLTPDLITNYTKIVFRNRLEVLSGPRKKADVDYERVYSTCKEIINSANKYFDIVFVDLNNGLSSKTTQEILKMSNIIILNMEQKKSEMEKMAKIRENKNLFSPEKILILVNNCDRKSKYNTKNMSREMGEKGEICSVPYSDLFSDAMQEGNTAEFFVNTRIKRIEDIEDRTGFFIHELKRTADAIIYKMQELQMRM